MLPVYCTAIGGSFGDVIRNIYTILYNFDRVLHQFLDTGTSVRCLIYIVQNLRFSGFILYPLSFFLYSPFKSNFYLDLEQHELSHFQGSRDWELERRVKSLKMFCYYTAAAKFTIMYTRQFAIQWPLIASCVH